MRHDDVHQIAADDGLALECHEPGDPASTVRDDPAIAPHLLHTRTPDGRTVRLPPPAVDTPHLVAAGRELCFAPDYGADTDRVLAEGGVATPEREALRARGVI